MSRQQHTRYQPRHDNSDERPDQPADQRNEQLDEDVACCLAEIDELLDTEAAEREQARREFHRFNRGTSDRVLDIWQARYAHLGLKYGRSCCGTPFIYGEHTAAEDDE
jgi:hypothetical protein